MSNSENTTLTAQEASKKISELLADARAAIAAAEALADEHSLEFGWDIAYGMGGSYMGKGVEAYGWDYEQRKEVYKPLEEGRWVSSSENC